jgi:hypothetical protein
MIDCGSAGSAMGEVAHQRGPQPSLLQALLSSNTPINQRSQMIGPTKLPNSPNASSIEEAQTYVRRCAEPRPAGDLVKAAIHRASKRLEIPSPVRETYGTATPGGSMRKRWTGFGGRRKRQNWRRPYQRLIFLRTKLRRHLHQVLIKSLRTYMLLCSLFNAIQSESKYSLPK